MKWEEDHGGDRGLNIKYKLRRDNQFKDINPDDEFEDSCNCPL